MIFPIYQSQLRLIISVFFEGYGHITPHSEAGRIVIMCYGLIGIPIFLLTIVKISTLMADIYIFIYKNIICLPCAIYSTSKQDHETDEELEHKRTGPVGIGGVSGTIFSQFDESGVLSESLSETKSVCDENFESFNEYEEEEESVRVPFVVIIGIVVVFFL